MEFSGRLRAAVSATPLSLQEISAALRERGTPVSISSLSAWQSGTSRPERAASLRALAELEDLLGLPRDELREKLPARLPRGRSRTQQLTPEEAWQNPASVTRVLARLGAVPNDPKDPQPLSQRLHLKVDELGHMRSLAISTMLLARRNGTTRIISVTDDDTIDDAPRVVTARGAKVGRFRGDPGTGISAYELLFPNPLEAGQLTLLDYTEYYPRGVDSTDLTIRIHPGAREVALGVEFARVRLPVECHAFHQKRADASEQPLEGLVSGTAEGGSTVQLVALDPAPGIYGIRWSFRPR
jgi:transcriptional regulator with XRE-family HTH domain